MLLAMVLIPIAAAIAAYFIRHDVTRRALLVITACLHLALTCNVFLFRPGPELSGWLAVGELELLFLGIMSVLFTAAAIYGAGYLKRASHHAGDNDGEFLFSNAPEATFTACMLVFLGTMTLSIIAQHFGLMWVAIEATTLSSAPMIYFHRNARSLEATWKYLLICSVGIGIALLGNFFLVVAMFAPADAGETAMTVEALRHTAMKLDPLWLKAAFILLLVGYGTKIGLAPMHTWLPDAHSEAPSMISALLSGVLLNCAMLCVLRIHSVCLSAGQGAFSGQLLVLLGLVSMGVAAVFIIAQKDFKRMLAYSSVEHMGIIAMGVGLGGLAGFGSLLHAVNHSATKAMLFFVAGNILSAYGTKECGKVTGLLRRLPASGFLWVAGFLAITGLPPFGMFVSELTILKGAINDGRYIVAGIYMLFLVMVFVGMAGVVIRMAFGDYVGGAQQPGKPLAAGESRDSIVPAFTLGLITLMLGVYVPAGLSDMIRGAMSSLGVR